MQYGRKIGKSLFPLALPVLAAAAGLSCNKPGRPGADPKEPTVTIHREEGSKIRIKVQIARTPEERAVGLMYRENLDRETGMLFIFEEEEIQTFWMKNTLIPLDMIFINDDFRIAGIVENAEPLSLSPRGVEEKSRFVLEVEAGFCSKYNIEKGMKVGFSGFTFRPGST
jgi:uncharacterized membrane protein (UPF0127 family)